MEDRWCDRRGDFGHTRTTSDSYLRDLRDSRRLVTLLSWWNALLAIGTFEKPPLATIGLAENVVMGHPDVLFIAKG